MRSSGILMHITSLPGPYGVGTLGREACRFVDFLRRAGQSYWQILPLTPTGYGDSPYQSCSTFAGNHYLIDLPTLVEEGLLRQEEPDSICWSRSDTKVDFGLLYKNRLKLLEKAWRRFPGGPEYEAFVEENRQWLPEFALFMALKDQYQGKPWYEWDEPLKLRDPDAIEKARRDQSERIRFYCFLQYLFHRQWTALHDYARDRGVSIIGDVPIYVPLDSVDVWSHPELFRLDESLTPTVVAGVPPDGFTADGQLWGNPIYNWESMEKDGFSWWIRRMEAAGRLYDVVRLDHFRGFASYWAVPYGDQTARNGTWVKGPGLAFIRALQKALPDLRLIAEDLGYLTEEVTALRDASGYPGMKVLEFAFDPREPSDYLPHTYEKNTVCYTGTHDNMTMRQWLDTASAECLAYAKAYMHLTEEEGYVRGVIRTAFASVSELCIVQMQDHLDLGGEARMNFPGTLSDSNWTWRVKNDMISENLGSGILAMTQLYGRLGHQKVLSAEYPL